MADPNATIPGPPPGFISNPSESRQAEILASAITTWIIGAVFVGLRFYARGWLLKNAIGVEDWLILVALVFSAATTAGKIEQVYYGWGKHFLDINLEVFEPMTRAGWYSIVWYMMSLLFTKIAICLLYLRVLSFRHARYVVYAILALVVIANGIWTLYTVLTACKPLTAFWHFDPAATAPAECRPLRDWLINTGLHIGTDFLMYLLPLPVVVSLRVPLRQKLALYGVMALGLLVCLVSVVRLWDLTEQNKRVDVSYENISIEHLTVIEINAAIACACCMTLRPLMNKWFPNLWGSRPSSTGAADGSPRALDVELGGGGGGGGAARGGGGALDETRGPPTIGSKPLRKIKVRVDDSELLGEDADEFGGAGRDEKRSIQTTTETDGLSFTETRSGSASGSGSGSASPWTPREPHLAHTAERSD